MAIALAFIGGVLVGAAIILGAIIYAPPPAP